MKRVLVVACLAAFGVVAVLLVGGDSPPSSPVTDSSIRNGSQTSPHAPETDPLEVPMESIPFEGPLSDSGKGRVVIQFLAADGRAVPGITAKIGDELRVSDKAGRAAWELDAGRYTWTHVGDEHLELNPPPRPSVTPHVRQRDGAIGWRTESENVARKESGELIVEASKTLDLKVLVHRGTSAIGPIPITERFPSWEKRRMRSRVRASNALVEQAAGWRSAATDVVVRGGGPVLHDPPHLQRDSLRAVLLTESF